MSIIQWSELEPISKNKSFSETYESKEICILIALVNEAANLVQKKGETSFEDFRRPSSKWRQKYLNTFVLDKNGTMLVHPDPILEGKNTIDLKDIDERPFVRGLIASAAAYPEKNEGWYHYKWKDPNQNLPRWKSSFVKRVRAPNSKDYIVGCEMYHDEMEKMFIIEMAKEAVTLIERKGKNVFPLFRDKTGRFMAKGAYIFVIDPNGIDLVDPIYPDLEERNIIDMKDINNKFYIREMLNVFQTNGSGWVNYTGENISSEILAYIDKAKFKDGWLLVGCGFNIEEEKGRLLH